MKFNVIDKTLVHCEGNDEIVVIPDGVMVITAVALTGCVSAKILKIPKSVVEIPISTCRNLNSLVGFVVDEDNSLYRSKDGVLFSKDEAILYRYPKGKPDTSCVVPNGVIIIDDNVFRECTNLVSVTIPFGVVEIGEWGFCDCTSLTNVMIPDSITNIDVAAFRHCTSLASITIPNSIKVLHNYVFDGCKNLTDLYVNANTEIEKSVLEELATLLKLIIHYEVD